MSKPLYEISGKEWHHLRKSILGGLSKDPDRYTLHNARIRGNQRELEFTSTDGHMLVREFISVGTALDNPEEPFEFYAPKEFFKALPKAKVHENIRIRFDLEKRHLHIQGSSEMEMEVFKENDLYPFPPDIDKVIPETTSCVWEFVTKEVVTTLECIIGALKPLKPNPMTMRIQQKGDRAIFITEHDTLKVEKSMYVTSTIEGDDSFFIGMDPEMLLSAIEEWQHDFYIRMMFMTTEKYNKIPDRCKTVVIRKANDYEGSLRIVMPQRVLERVS